MIVNVKSNDVTFFFRLKKKLEPIFTFFKRIYLSHLKRFFRSISKIFKKIIFKMLKLFKTLLLFILGQIINLFCILKDALNFIKDSDTFFLLKTNFFFKCLIFRSNLLGLFFYIEDILKYFGFYISKVFYIVSTKMILFFKNLIYVFSPILDVWKISTIGHIKDFKKIAIASIKLTFLLSLINIKKIIKKISDKVFYFFIKGVRGYCRYIYKTYPTMHGLIWTDDKVDAFEIRLIDYKKKK